MHLRHFSGILLTPLKQRSSVKEWREGQTEDFCFSGVGGLPESATDALSSVVVVLKSSVVCGISIFLCGRVAELFERPSYVQRMIIKLWLAWRMREQSIVNVLCCTVVYHSCAQWYVHTHGQFLQISVGFCLFFVSFCILARASLLVLGLVFCSVYVCIFWLLWVITSCLETVISSMTHSMLRGCSTLPTHSGFCWCSRVSSSAHCIADIYCCKLSYVLQSETLILPFSNCCRQARVCIC